MKQQLKPIHLACVEDETRPNLALIQIKNKCAYATNARVLAKIDLKQTTEFQDEDLDVLEGKYIHKEVWKQIHKSDVLQFEDDCIVCYKRGIKNVLEYSKPEGVWFDTESILLDIVNNGGDEKISMLYSPDSILILSKIFGNSQMKFSFSKSNLGTLVYPYYGCGCFGVIMPLLDESPTERYHF